MGIRAIQSQAFPAEFVRCYKTDFKGAGANNTPLRQFTNTTGIPGDRTQSVRTVVQDTPHVQTGPRVNILRASDFVLQNDESTSDTDLVDFNSDGGYPWKLVGGPTAGKVVFGKWGAFSDANIDMSPAAFYLGLQPGDALAPADPQLVYNDLIAFNLSTTATKVVTYQGLCRVMGKVRFAIVNSDPPHIVYDETVIDSQGAFTDLIQVTLRAQLAEEGGTTPTYFRIVIENLLVSTGTLAGMARLKVLSQQAWGGKAGDGTYPLPVGLTNSTFAYTDDGAAYKSTYPWSANTLSVRAQSRLKIPSKPRRYGWEVTRLICSTATSTTTKST